MMQNAIKVRLNAYTNNIECYRRLLRTQLTDLERQYIFRRLEEEEKAAALLRDCPLPLSSGQASPTMSAGVS